MTDMVDKDWKIKDGKNYAKDNGNQELNVTKNKS